MRENFRRSPFTAIVSDMHLCEGEPVHPEFPLWKKFKTKQFFYDETFAEFLNHIEAMAEGHSVELILNGDIFDFDSVTAIPESPSFRVEWLETRRGLYPRPERSKYKIQVILKDHQVLVKALADFIRRGHRAVFVIGNHDLELHFPEVQAEIMNALQLQTDEEGRVRFCEWFYISNQDTLIEHGNQYDPYCSCDDPVNPFVQGYNYKAMRLPFGNLACRYILNGMGFFNPHVESNFIMTLPEYIRFFVKYMLRAQPTLMFDWFFGAMVTLWKSFIERFMRPVRDPLKIEDKINSIAQKANAEPRMVRELRELFVDSASNNPFLIMRELWLDRAFLVMLAFIVIFQLMLVVKQFFAISFFWAFIPLFILVPFFVFYTRSVTSLVSSFKEPDERILSTACSITGVQRVIYGHTHLIRHEMIGAVEHLNSGCWSAAFLDVECTQAIDQKTFVWLRPSSEGYRDAELRIFKEGKSEEVMSLAPKSKK